MPKGIYPHKRATREQTIARFWSKVAIPPDRNPDVCWEWQAGKKTEGYGIFFFMGKKAKAHRIAYELVKGEIPKGMAVCHSCDNPACCNPAHLWLGTIADNNRDMREKGRASGNKTRGDSHPTAKYTQADFDRVLELRKQGYSLPQIHRETGISLGHVGNICNGKARR